MKKLFENWRRYTQTLQEQEGGFSFEHGGQSQKGEYYVQEEDTDEGGRRKGGGRGNEKGDEGQGESW